MNADRRKRIQELIDTISAFENDIDELASEEQEYYDNMPESFQSGEKGDRAQEAASALESARDSIGEVVTSLEEALNA